MSEFFCGKKYFSSHSFSGCVVMHFKAKSVSKTEVTMALSKTFVILNEIGSTISDTIN